MPLRKIIAICLADFLTFAGIFLVWERGGILAWLAIFLGTGLFLKALLRPSKMDPAVVVTVILLWAVSWQLTFSYIISTWESGEVVELQIPMAGDTHVARIWVLDVDAIVTMYYDAEPEVAAVLLSGAPIQVTRNGAVLNYQAFEMRAVSDIPQAQMNAIFAAMTAKYGELNAATDLFYRFLGRSRDRVAVVIELVV